MILTVVFIVFCFQVLQVIGSMHEVRPAEASRMRTAPSRTLKAHSTSLVKSMWPVWMCVGERIDEGTNKTDQGYQ